MKTKRGIYLNIDKQESDLKFEYTWMDVKNYEVENYIGKNIKEIKSKYFSFEIVGDGEKVISQLPKYKEKIKFLNYKELNELEK